MIQYWLPSPSLRSYVRQLQLIRFDFSGVPVLPFKAYWPRPENCLTFYPRDLETVIHSDRNAPQIKPRSIHIGQPTVLTNRHMGRDFMVFQVVFQPGALFRLTGLPIYELTDTFVDAEAVFSTEIRNVNERLSSTENYEEMTVIIETFLSYLVRKSSKIALPIDSIGQLMMNVSSSLPHSVDWLAQEACLSPKQFYRKSVERLGISPKLFGRLIRFNQAAKLRNAYPTKDWLSVAIESGYHDYQHLVRDFKEFTTFTPNEFLVRDTPALKCGHDVVRA